MHKMTIRQSSLDYSTPTEYDSSSSPFPTPTPVHEPRCSYHTGYTPEKKKSKRTLFTSPDTKKKIDDIHHYQYHQMELQKEMYYEQKVTSSRLSFLENIAMRFCGSSNMHNPGTTHHASSSSQRPAWEPSPQRPPITPNTMTRANVWSPLRPYIEDEHKEESPKTPRKSSSKKSSKSSK